MSFTPPPNPPPEDKNIVRLQLSAQVDNYDLASLLNPLIRNSQYRICLDVSRVALLGTVEFRVLTAFAASFQARGGFLKLENANTKVASLMRDFGCTHLLNAPNLSPTI